MQKVTTQGYEVMARLLSVEPLHQTKIEKIYYISYANNLQELLNNIKIQYLGAYMIASSHTVRGAWKKACKVLNGKVDNV